MNAAALIASGLALAGAVIAWGFAERARTDSEANARDAVAAAVRAEAARDAIVPPYREDARPATERPSLVAVSDETLAAIRRAEWCRNARSER
ncbi:hypothetical protein [Nocardia wallacei]|uniref:hypothetical protein n=1 Tax=Nocardia wallacei TaxID=480035 RepID=UPI0024537C1C|nr:hypothetical protein [Nocardia wallacei]